MLSVLKGSPFVTLGLGAALALSALGGCKKDEPADPVVPTADTESPTTVAPQATTLVADEIDAAAPEPADAATTAEPESPTTTGAPAGGGASIDACCKALGAIQESGRDDVAKRRAEAGAAMCKTIAPLVKSGKTPKHKALIQVRSALQGITIPGECR